jgi:hypothetical protein
VVTAEPPEGSVVRDREGDTWTHHPDGWRIDRVTDSTVAMWEDDHAELAFPVMTYRPITLVRWGPAPTVPDLISDAVVNAAFAAFVAGWQNVDYADLSDPDTVPDRCMRAALEAALPLLAGELAADHAAAGRAIGCYLGVDSPSLADDARALVDRCVRAEAARDAALERLESERVAGDEMAVLNLRVRTAESTLDMLTQRVQTAREILTRAATCHSDNRIEYIDEADQILSLGGAE